MVQFLKIASTSTTNPVDMFTLGVSTARGVDGKIGQFGSGSLMSTLLWLRLHGESPVYFLNGVRVEFESRPEKTSTGDVFHRVYQAVDGVETPLSVSLEYGEIDWTESHMSLREWISNAIDQGAEISECVSKVDSLDCDDSQVAVFVPMNADVRKYWQNIDKYFLHFRDMQGCKVIPKAKKSACRLYRKGVFVRELAEVQSRWDYNLDLPINECRTGSSDSMESLIRDVIHGTDGIPVEYYATLFDLVTRQVECYETTWSSSYLYAGWRRFLTSEAVEGIKVIRKDSKRKGTGYPVESCWYDGFIKINPALSGYDDLYSEKQGIITLEPSPELLTLASRCWKFLTALVATDKPMPDVLAFKTIDGDMPSYLGRYDGGKHRVFIWQDQQASTQTMLEEMAHAISGKSDCSRDFQEYLFRCLTETMSVIE